MSLRLFALVVCILASATASPAQTPGARDVEGTLIDELVVNGGPTGGPAFWTVADGDSKVFILGVPGALPKGTQWATAKLEARLKGANGLILPPNVRASPFKAVAFFLTQRKSFQSPRPMEETLPPALRDRFVAARQQLGKKPARYAKWKPAVAGVLMAGDFRGAARVSLGEPQGKVRALARAAGVREHRVASYDAMPVLRQFTTLPDEAHRACLADTLTEVEAGAGRLQIAAQGWARGDVKAALTAERGYDRCLASAPAVGALIERGMADTAAAIAGAMGKPGKTVAVVELRQLLARGGVLDRLRARGFRIETPE